MAMLRPRACSAETKYCPGCGHGIANRILAEVLEESGRDKRAIGAIGVGCSSLMPDTFDIDCVQAPHGRAAAVAVGLKRCRPDCAVFAYQGDGDALAIGLSETMWAAIRNERITVIFVNNGTFGMTGGQMAPTTLEGQKTSTTPMGRDAGATGRPLDIIKILRGLDIAYLARGSLSGSADIATAKKYLMSAFDAQDAGYGYSFVEMLSPCPTNWGMSPSDAMKHINGVVRQTYPTGEFLRGGGNE
ncbi:MAG: 2-oxoglutarate oxidoreductase [Synergistaceae bacterium]|jgi:2-oxoglutarate ferredoxin oxidoreductase subunit beta|nr:2-oxoglutarate oxidoreductase [Synergistaceae bacterium]